MTITPMHRVTAKVDHNALYDDVCKLLDKYAGKMKPEEILAVAANIVGKLVAMQDQRRMTPEEALALVSANIEEGDQDVIARLAATGGRRQ